MRHDLETVIVAHSPMIDRLSKMEVSYINALDSVLDDYGVGYNDRHIIYDSIRDLFDVKDCLNVLVKENQ